VASIWIFRPRDDLCGRFSCAGSQHLERLNVPTEAITYHETYGLPPRQYAVTFELAGKRRVLVRCGDRQRALQWNGGGYRPRSRAQREAAIECFIAIEHGGTGIERANTELLHARAPAPEPRAPARAACVCHDDRQLPAGDRS